MLATVRQYFGSLLSVFYPPFCAVCGDTLTGGEQFFCLECQQKLPLTNYYKFPDNPAFQRFLGRADIDRACSYLFYNKDGVGQKIVAAIKYQGDRKLGKFIGAKMAEELLPSGFFEGVDFLVPVPLHPSKERKRGFNQSEIIAQGISEKTGITIVADNVFRKRANVSQTRKGVFERWLNTKEIFDVKNPQMFENKTLMIIDDVLTTGSTLEAVAQSILKSKGAKAAVLTLAIA
jgi:ComF family protein